MLFFSSTICPNKYINITFNHLDTFFHLIESFIVFCCVIDKYLEAPSSCKTGNVPPPRFSTYYTTTDLVIEVAK